MATQSSTVSAVQTLIESRPVLSFSCDSEGVSFNAISFSLSEGLSEIYEARVRVHTDVPIEELPSRLLGQVGHLTFGADRVARTVHGIIRAIETTDTVANDGEKTCVDVLVVPKLGLLANRKTSRIFQDQTVMDVVDTILREWSIPRRWALSTTPSAWLYNVQHQESDLEFIRRILAAEGIFFFFEEAAADEVAELADGVCVVFGDSSAAYGSVDGSSKLAGIEPALLTAPRNQPMGHNQDRLFSFGEKHSLAPANVLLRDYNCFNANADTSAGATSTYGDRPDRLPLSKLRSTYEYLPQRPFDARNAPVALEQLRRESRMFMGEASSSRLRAGYLFSVRGQIDASLEGTYLVTALTTRGHDPRYALTGTNIDETLIQELRAVRATDVHRPARLHRSQHQGFDTAVVVGPPDTPVVSDSLGRVRVRFHWDDDRPGIETEGLDWTARSTWLRVSQPWNGAGHGAFFLPRVGSEVLVGYIGGDINRPVIVGALPNTAQPPPFSLPTDIGKTGIVTRGLASQGQSELTFDDTGGRESAKFSSQRKLELHAVQDIEHRAGRNESTDVAESSILRVGQDRREQIEGERIASVNQKSSLLARSLLEVEALGSTRVTLATSSMQMRGDTSLTFDAPLECRSQSDVRMDVDGITSLRHRDTLFVSVGAPEKPASHLLHVEGSSTHEAKSVLELLSDQEIVLRSGDSAIHITPDAIQIRTAKVRIDADTIELCGSNLQLKGDKFIRLDAPKVFALSEGASLSLTSMAKLNGSNVKLGAPPDASDGPEAKKDAAPPTLIKLVDQDGKPVAGERCLVRLSDGTTRAAVTDEKGVARLFDLAGSAQADFVDLSNWEKR